VVLVQIFRRSWVNLLALPTRVVEAVVAQQQAQVVLVVLVVVVMEVMRHLKLPPLERQTLVVVVVAVTTVVLLVPVDQESFISVEELKEMHLQQPQVMVLQPELLHHHQLYQAGLITIF
jgi:hypothetical protein